MQLQVLKSARPAELVVQSHTVHDTILFKKTKALVDPQSHLPSAFQVSMVLMHVHSLALFLDLVKVPVVPHFKQDPSPKVTSVTLQTAARLRVVDDTVTVKKRKVSAKHSLIIGMYILINTLKQNGLKGFYQEIILLKFALSILKISFLILFLLFYWI